MFDSRNTWNVQYIGPSNLWDAKRNGTTICMCLSCNTWMSSTLRGATYTMENTMEQGHSCLIVVTHKTSNTLHRATYGMQKSMELRPSCLIVATHERSSTMRTATGVTFQHSQILRLPRKVTLQHHEMLRLPRKVTLQHHEMLRLPWNATLQHHEMLRLTMRDTTNRMKSHLRWRTIRTWFEHGSSKIGEWT